METQAINYREETQREIEKKTGIRVPRFITDITPIDYEESIRLAVDLGLADPIHNAWYLSQLGVLFCRRRGITPEQARHIPKEQVHKGLSQIEIFEKFNSASPNRKALAVPDTSKRDQLDNDLLNLELDLLRVRGVKTPHLATLSEYASWINKAQPPEHVIWAIYDHHIDLIIAAKKAANPLEDWKNHFMKVKDLSTSWRLQILGDEDLGYHSQRNRFATEYGEIMRPSSVEYQSPLITHTTRLSVANQIITEGQLFEYRNNFSAGRVVFAGWEVGDEVTFIFPRKTIESATRLYPYSETYSYDENEMRTFDPVSLDYCIGAVPATKEIFPDKVGESQTNTVWGEEVIRRWSENYLHMGSPFDAQDLSNIRQVALKYS